jgi:hypothetical protein
MIRVTLDTNVLDGPTLARVWSAASRLPIEFGAVSVSVRELHGRRETLPPVIIRESAIWNESEWNACNWSKTVPVPPEQVDDCALEDIVRIVSSGSLQLRDPDAMKAGERRQLRDAMIFEAHVREKRDVLVTNDRAGFVGTGDTIRAELERCYSTRIMTVDEFIAYCETVRAATSPPEQQ